MQVEHEVPAKRKEPEGDEASCWDEMNTKRR